MALLDVSDIVLDPDFCDAGIICERNTQVIDNNGIASNKVSSRPFAGVVTNDRGDTLRRLITGERTEGNINIITLYPLEQGTATRTADVVVWKGVRYTVSSVLDYSNFGKGFTIAKCDRIPLNQ